MEDSEPYYTSVFSLHLCALTGSWARHSYNQLVVTSVTSTAICSTGCFVNHWKFQQSSQKMSAVKPEELSSIKYDPVSFESVNKVVFAQWSLSPGSQEYFRRALKLSNRPVLLECEGLLKGGCHDIIGQKMVHSSWCKTYSDSRQKKKKKLDLKKKYLVYIVGTVLNMNVIQKV